MFKFLKVVLLFIMLSFFSQKSEANAIFIFYTYDIPTNQKQTTLSENDANFQDLGLPNEINYRLSNANLKVDFSSVQKKIQLKLLSNCSFSREQYFRDIVKLIWSFCNINDISFTTFQIIFPFHYFW